MMKGDRVVYTASNLPNLFGAAGEIEAVGAVHATVKFDKDRRIRVIELKNLRLENTIMNIKNYVKTAIDALMPKSGVGLNGLARELLVATSASSAADSRKKKAKEAAIAGGLIQSEYRPGEVITFEDTEFKVVAKTSEPGERLDVDALRAELKKARISEARIATILSNSMVANKAATRYEVIQK